MQKIILILFLFISYPVFAEYNDKWIAEDTILQTAFLGTLTIDTWQTYTFLYTEDHREQGRYEENPILGKYPSKKRFFSYWSACAIGHTLISYYLPKPYRNFWQLIWIGVESNYIYHNYQAGVRINF